MDPQNNNQCKKSNTLFNTDVSNVFVVKNAKRRAFIEQFSYTSVNFTQKDLGTILGFFIVRDHSASSENIVNFLASEIKKHYFSTTQKPIEEKFESTLHHINRALEELANIGNVDWLGTIDGAVCAFDGSSIHFSVTGHATILLLRNNTLINISEGLASPEAADYPLKTFVDISSGDVCAHDKIIITSHELFELISLDELQKNANRMGQKNFVQFIETALTNECTIASTTIIDVQEQEQPHSTVVHDDPGSQKALPTNFFSANTFEQNPAHEDILHESEIDINSLTQEDPLEYTDPRTGHIHIQGTDDITYKTGPLDGVSEFFSDMRESLGEKAKKQRRALTKKFSSLRKSEQTTSIDDEQVQFLDETSISSDALENDPATQSPSFLLKILSLWKYCQTIFSSSWTFICAQWKKISTFIMSFAHHKQPDENSHSHKYDIPVYTQQTRSMKKFLPDMKRAFSLWQSMGQKTRLTTIAIIAAIIFIPLIMKVIPDKSPTIDTPDQNETQTAPPEMPNNTSNPPEQIPTNETSSGSIVSSSLFTSSNIHSVIALKTIILGIEKEAIILLSQSDKARITLPSDAGSIVFATQMPDLNTIFVITDANHLYTFSPASPKFVRQEQSPKIEHTKIKDIGTFMTYLYIMDDTMITRFARIENGFDEGKNWLKKSTDLKNATAMTIGESIYIVQDHKLQRFTQGNSDNITVDPAVTNIDLIFTSVNSNFLWIIDKNTKTLYKLNNTDHKISEKFTHDNFAQATTLSVDEASNKAYISTKSEILDFSLKK